jgi:catechol 1,2-dioxygenase
MSSTTFSRRLFLSRALVGVPAAGTFVLGCRTAAAGDPAAPRCVDGIATAANIEGPYYRADAPFRSDLVDPGVVGAPLVLAGNVLSLDCRSPIAGAVLDVWQANGDGHYDNDGTMRLPEGAMRLRGKVRCDSKGAFSAKSVLPGRYLNGSRYRPAHIHVKVTAPGHLPLTTQLYFPGDPYNDGDPFIDRSLIVDLARVRGDAAARFDFVLTPAPRRQS